MLVLVGSVASVGVGRGLVTPVTPVSVNVDVGTVVTVDVGIFFGSFPPVSCVLVGVDVGWWGCDGPSVVSVGEIIGDGDAGAVAVEVGTNEVGVGVGANEVGVGVASQAELPPQIPRQSTTLPLLQLSLIHI